MGFDIRVGKGSGSGGGSSTVWKANVATVGALTTTYPDAKEGWAAIVNADGKAYSFNGTVWVQGVVGPQGVPGTSGAAGVSITSVTGPVTVGLVDTYTVHFSNGNTTPFVIHNGTDGTNGTNGINGTNGTNGINGTNGVDGHSPVITFSGTHIIVDGVQGPDLKGQAGNDGTNGTNGVDGVGISSVTGPVTVGRNHTYTLHLSNGATQEFTVSDGTNGIDGAGQAETTQTIKDKLGITTLSGSNTGDQDLTGLSHTNRTALDAVTGTNTGDQDLTGLSHSNRSSLDLVSGTNTGDETATSIKTKLGVSTLSGSNTGDQDLSTLAPKASPTFTGAPSVAAGVDYTTAKFRNIVLSTADPSGGNTGDIWIKYTP